MGKRGRGFIHRLCRCGRCANFPDRFLVTHDPRAAIRILDADSFSRVLAALRRFTLAFALMGIRLGHCISTSRYLFRPATWISVDLAAPKPETSAYGAGIRLILSLFEGDMKRLDL